MKYNTTAVIDLKSIRTRLAKMDISTKHNEEYNQLVTAVEKLLLILMQEDKRNSPADYWLGYKREL